MPSYDELRAASGPVWAAFEKPQRPLFVVSINTSSIASGATETLAALRALSARDGFDVGVTGDTGLAWAEPVVQVRRPDAPTVLYGRVTADKAGHSPQPQR
jgi:NADH-quinone oxidoreductase subunit F